MADRKKNAQNALALDIPGARPTLLGLFLCVLYLGGPILILGNLVDYRITMSDGTLLQVQQPATAAFAPGDEVHATLPAERAWLVRDDAA